MDKLSKGISYPIKIFLSLNFQPAIATILPLPFSSYYLRKQNRLTKTPRALRAAALRLRGWRAGVPWKNQ
jgi:hypothetical protein